jgi:ATP-dependent DNA helicase RecG
MDFDLTQITLLSEDYDLEAKKALGRDGLGELPENFWHTYSAMANTEGGIILLGVEEKPRGKFTPIGIVDDKKVLKSLWDGLNNKNIVSINLLSDKEVRKIPFQDKILLQITIPRARRQQRPVYCGTNPLSGIYKRNYEGDYLCPQEVVQRMLAERMEDSLDSRILHGYTFPDFDLQTLKAYRNRFAASKPDHPWNDCEMLEFLRRIRAWGKDRDQEEGKEGPTLAGLLMFGRLESILEAVSTYIVDYQERPAPKAEARWIDRLTTDGTWSGNLYDFYQQVYRKLTADIKIPFKLKGDKREDETPVHEAIREALVNTLIHADYSGRVSVLIVKRSDMFGFRNPGTMRIPIKNAVHGGDSDCRNRILQKMFQFIGLGEQAGSGIPKILRNWKSQLWQRPHLYEKQEQPEQTLLELRMVSLLPSEIVEELDECFGKRFRELPEVERIALATAAIEKTLTHTRLLEITGKHPHDLTKTLAILVRDGFLESEGIGRGMCYFIAGRKPEKEIEAFTAISNSNEHKEKSTPIINSEHLRGNSEHLRGNSEHLRGNSEHLKNTFESRSLLEADINLYKDQFKGIRDKGKIPKEEMKCAIIHLCQARAMSLKEISEILDRTPDTLRNHYLIPMTKNGEIFLLYPEKINHPKQRYKADK